MLTTMDMLVGRDCVQFLDQSKLICRCCFIVNMENQCVGLRVTFNSISKCLSFGAEPEMIKGFISFTLLVTGW